MPPATYCLPLTTHYLLPTIFYLLPNAYFDYSLRTTHYPLLTIHYPLLATHHLALTFPLLPQELTPSFPLNDIRTKKNFGKRFDVKQKYTYPDYGGNYLCSVGATQQVVNDE